MEGDDGWMLEEEEERGGGGVEEEGGDENRRRGVGDGRVPRLWGGGEVYMHMWRAAPVG